MRATPLIGRVGGLGGITTWVVKQTPATITEEGRRLTSPDNSGTYGITRGDRSSPRGVHIEFTVLSIGSRSAGNGDLAFGIAGANDSAFPSEAISAAGTFIGNAGTVNRGALTGGVLVPGDVFAIEVDPTSGQISYQRLGFARQTVANSFASATHWIAAAARYTASVKMNTGQEAFQLPLTPGFGPYG